MRKKLLSITVLAFMCLSLFAQTPYANFPYYRNVANTPFQVPTDKVDADLTTTTNRASFVMLGAWFDQTNSGSVPSYTADDNVTIIKDATEGAANFTPTATDDRIVSETTEVTAHAKWSTAGDWFDRRGMTLYYTVNFSAAGDYKLYFRQRNAGGPTYIVDVFNKANMDAAIKTFTLNTGGITAVADVYSTNRSAQYVTAGGGSSHWVKTVDVITIANPGDYVIKIKTAKVFGYNFGGFTVFPVPAAAVAEIALTKPVAPGAAVAVNKVASLKALATPAGANTISKVEFFEGENLLGQGTLVAGFYEFNWTPTATGSYVISAKLTESDNTVTTSTTSNIQVVNSLAYVTRSAWTDVVQAEDYDLGGGEYGAFYDLTTIAANAIAGYRTDGTDAKHKPAGHCVQLGNDGTGWTVGYTAVGEKLNYSIKDVPTGNIQVTVNYATPNATAQLKISLNGEVLTTMALPSTTSWTVFQNATSEAISFVGDENSDDDVLTIEFVGSGSNLDFFSLATAVSTQIRELNAASFEIYPNPSQGIFTINSGTSKASFYRILSLSGQTIQSGSFVGKIQLNLNADKGIYMLETKIDGNKSMQKIVIK